VNPLVLFEFRMRDFRIDPDLRLFCIIDGYDTLRLLRAYAKCGFTPPDAAT
jgi:hypothetical protein